MDQNELNHRENEEKIIKELEETLPPVPRMAENLALLAKRWNLTEPDDPVPYTLTPQEEQRAIDYQVDKLKNHLAWRMAHYGHKEDAILAKIAGIDWEQEIDRAAILKAANSSKEQAIWFTQQREREKQEKLKRQAELEKLYTAEYLYKFMAWASEENYHRPWRKLDGQKLLVSALCYFLARDERFESELGYDLNKGLILRSEPGRGKTHLVRCLSQNGLRPISVHSMIDIAEQVAEHGVMNLPVRENGIIYLDDVGSEEPEVLHFGTRINFYKTFIEKQYLASNTYNHLIISTNISHQEMEAKYSIRVRSRHKEMFNTINIDAEDLRVSRKL